MEEGPKGQITNEEKERRKDLLPRLAERFQNGESISILAAESRIPEKTLYRYFKKGGVEREVKPIVSALAVRKVIQQKVTDELTGEADNLGTIAVGLGSVMARRYLPLLDHLMSQGKTLEMIAEDVMGWFETRKATEMRIRDLEGAVEDLRKSLREAYEAVEPNYIFKVKSEALERFAAKALQYRRLGVRFPVKAAIRSFQTDLDNLEREIKNMKETI